MEPRERAGRLLVISNREEDRAFGRAMAASLGLHYSHAINRDQVRHALATYPETLVFWDAEQSGSYESIGEILPKYAPARQVFAITDKPISSYFHLFSRPIYDHHLVRRFLDPLPELLTLLISSLHPLQTSASAGLGRYFPPGTATKKLVITRTLQKMAATEAIENYLTRQGIRGRLSSLVAQSLDELIMNAIFHASPRKGLKPGADFALPEREQVEVELASTETYMAACVTDHFGTLNRSQILEAMQSEGRKEDAGIGTGGIYQAGLSLIFRCRPKEKTQAMLFFQRAETYKEFRKSFRLLSLQFSGVSKI